ncbi:hypothetical protein BJ138DRAFT_1142020 [Hygrophoropsis aurantiaca]|uniref:Uncharacterized protein n=1 Tax=Hygrophoropsis aurantiaca TaxID=72124 RepID=A0ACB8AQD2_9AGAM|nr:hypothetical protein BJ138DRAFT_1142020 [Hygrophoropsis aurantiaca]
MSPIPARETLQGMKRVDIQRLCKDYGVKANLKTEALIDLLLDASQPHPPKHIFIQPPQRSTSTRVTSLPGSRPRGRSNGSVIIHDTDDDEDPQVDEHAEQQLVEEKPPPLPAAQLSRTKKAKDTQYRLGVGRPALAGGSGARAVTKSVNVSRGAVKRVRPSRSTKAQEATIAEEEPEANTPVQTSTLEEGCTSSTSRQAPEDPITSTNQISNAISDRLSPIHNDLRDQKSELQDLKNKVASIVESFETKIRELTAEIASLRHKVSNVDNTETQASINSASDFIGSMQVPPSTPKRVQSLRRTSNPSDVMVEMKDSTSALLEPERNLIFEGQNGGIEDEGHITTLLPGFPATILGKRSRDSAASNITGIFEVEQGDDIAEKELETRIARPAHKRAKLLSEPDGIEEMDRGEGSSNTLLGPSKDESTHDDQQSMPARLPNFTIFSGPDEHSTSFIDPPPPTTSLPDFYGPPSPPMMSAPATSTANASENQHPFTFSFLPISSTPAHNVYPLSMGSFPVPEPPTSPSPANNVERPGSRHSHSYNPFGVPRSGSESSTRVVSGGSGSAGQAEASGSGEANLASLGRGRPPQREPSSNEVASGLGLTAIRTGAAESSPDAAPAKRTMYGTELEDDTRFGDFGVEGVASGFWAGGRF